MKKLVALFAAGALCALSLAALSAASTRSTVWSATLGAAQEVPKQVVKNTSATGTFKGTLKGNKLTWTLTFSKLTGAAAAAHIHMAPKGVSGNVVVALCGPCKSPARGTATVNASIMSAFKKGNLYVNVHTAKNPNGEIRGQLAAASA